MARKAKKYKCSIFIHRFRLHRSSAQPIDTRKNRKIFTSENPPAMRYLSIFPNLTIQKYPPQAAVAASLSLLCLNIFPKIHLTRGPA